MKTESRRAWMTFLTSNNYYIYLLLGLYKNMLDVNTKYPFYCGVTKNVNGVTRKLLTDVGIKIIDLNTSLIDESNLVTTAANKKMCDWYRNALTKLSLLESNVEEKFDKIVYLDTDIQVFKNIDDLFDHPHMSAVQDLAPHHVPHEYTYGCSMFCSGLFVWDFEHNKGEGHRLLTTLNDLDLKKAWHDQNILNYWYKDWWKTAELQLDYSYCLMNAGQCLKKAKAAGVTPKAMHFVDRDRNNWPYERPVTLPARFKEFRAWVGNLEDASEYFKKKYKIDLPRLRSGNIRLQEDISRASSKKDANGSSVSYYLYF